MTVFRQGNSQHSSASTKQKGGLGKAGTAWFPCQISTFCAVLEEGASIVVSPYNVTSGNTSLKHAREVPCNTGWCQHQCLWKRSLAGSGEVASSVSHWKGASVQTNTQGLSAPQRGHYSTAAGRRWESGEGAFICFCSWTWFCEATALTFHHPSPWYV